MPKSLRWLHLISFFVVILTTFFICKGVSADNYYFNDEFTGSSLDGSKWQAFPNDGTITVGSDVVWLRNGHVRTFPFVYSKVNPFPTSGDFSTEFKIQYTEATFWGTGAAISTDIPTNGQNEPDALLKFWVWQDTTVGSPGFSLNFEQPNQPPQVIFSKLQSDLAEHVVKLDYIEGVYKVYLDNSLIFTSGVINERPKVFWFGNPFLASVTPNWNWTAFKLDYLRVQQLNTKTPLILIPGIGGSEFKVTEDTVWSQPDGHGGTFNHIYPKDEQVWVNENEAKALGNDDYFDILKLKSDGQTPEANLKLTGTLFGTYQDTINFFTTNGYEINKTLFIFPYDWRKDLSLTASLLDEKVQQIKQQTGSQKVDMVAHSMGGLVARNYVKDSTRAQNVSRLIELGTPHLGSVDLIKKLLYGECFTKDFLKSSPVCIGLSGSEVKDVIQNMTGGFELAPTKKYFDFYDGSNNNYPFPLRDDADLDSNNVKGPLNYNQIKTLLANLAYNTSLYTFSESFHTLDDNLSNTNGVDIRIIAGSGIPTIGQIIEKNLVNLGNIRIPKKDELMINGDDTVPLFSAALKDDFRNLFLNGNAQVYYTKQDHGELATDGPALNLAKNILTNNAQIPTGISTNPYQLNGKQLSVHSPVNIHVYDQNGNHTGPTSNGDFETNIPGSLYETLDDAKFIWLPDEGQYIVKFESTGEGSFDFKIRDFESDVNTKTVLFKNNPLTNFTKALANLNTNLAENTSIQIDLDGNNVIDSVKNPDSVLMGEEGYDYISPVITISTPQKDQTFTLNQPANSSFQCIDDNSGIDKCIGTVDSEQPLDTSSVGNKSFRVYAEDKAGNTVDIVNNYLVQYAKTGLCLGQLGHQVLQPINSDGTSVFKQGSTIPIKFRVCDNNNISVSSSGLINGFTLMKSVSGTTINVVNESPLSTTPDSTFRWDPITQQWIFNMNTKNLTAGKTYFYKISLNDISSVEFSFGLR